jgi:hypothetical protein
MKINFKITPHSLPLLRLPEVPVDGGLQAGFKVGFSLEFKEFFGPARIEAAPGLARPVPQHSIYFAPVWTASTHFLIKAGITWELSGLKLSRGP